MLGFETRLKTYIVGINGARFLKSVRDVRLTCASGVLCEIAKRIGGNVEIDRDCSRRAVSLSCEVEFQMAPNLPEQPAARPHQQDFCRVSGGNSLPNDENARSRRNCEGGKDLDACHRPDSGLMATVNSNSFGSKYLRRHRLNHGLSSVQFATPFVVTRRPIS